MTKCQRKVCCAIYGNCICYYLCIKLFYRTYPIATTLRSQLNWSQYRRLIQIEDPDKREYYELESVNNAWTARETERQINSMLYERLLMSNDKL